MSKIRIPTDAGLACVAKQKIAACTKIMSDQQHQRRVGRLAAHLALRPTAASIPAEDPPSATFGGDPPLLVTRVGPPMDGYKEGRHGSHIL